MAEVAELLAVATSDRARQVLSCRHSFKWNRDLEAHWCASCRVTRSYLQLIVKEHRIRVEEASIAR